MSKNPSRELCLSREKAKQIPYGSEDRPLVLALMSGIQGEHRGLYASLIMAFCLGRSTLCPTLLSGTQPPWRFY